MNSCGYINRSCYIFHKVLQECITKWESKQLGKQGMIYFPVIVIPMIALELIAHIPTWTWEITTWWRHINKTRFLGSTNLEFHTVSWHLNKIWSPKSRTDTNTLFFFTETTFPNFDVAKLVFSPPPNTSNHEKYVDLTTGLSLKKFLSFWCFDSRWVVFWG